MPFLADHIPKLIHNSGCIIGRAMTVPTLWRTPMCHNLLLCNFHKNYAPQASLLKSSIVELKDNSTTVASYLEDGIQYSQMVIVVITVQSNHQLTKTLLSNYFTGFVRSISHEIIVLLTCYSNTANTYTSSYMRDFRLQLQCKWDVRSSDILCTAGGQVGQRGHSKSRGL